jgi:hypothetical protein
LADFVNNKKRRVEGGAGGIEISEPMLPNFPLGAKFNDGKKDDLLFMQCCRSGSFTYQTNKKYEKP